MLFKGYFKGSLRFTLRVTLRVSLCKDWTGSSLTLG